MRYFSGQGQQLGHVSPLPQQTFKELCDDVLTAAIPLAISSAAFFALPVKSKDAPNDQQRVKRVKYITPAVFKIDDEIPFNNRRYEYATHCNLIALDVDDAEDATRLIEQGWECLAEYGHCVWHTASSTPEKPRLRIIVSSDGIPIARYPTAVRTVGEILGLTKVTTESRVSVQPMFLPVLFAGSDESPIISSNPEGAAFSVNEIVGDDATEPSVDGTPATDPADGPLGDLDFLRTPMDGVTLGDAADALTALDPDCSMQDWIEAGMALKHQFGEKGFATWDEWSSKGEKYEDHEESEYRWSTLKAQPTDRNPITIRSLFHNAQLKGWSSKTLTKKTYDELIAWVKTPSRSTEEILDQGAKRIAKISSALGSLERKLAMVAIRDTLSPRGMKLSLADLRKEVQKYELETTQKEVPPWASSLCYVTSLNVFYRHSVDRRFKPDVLDLMYTSPAVGDEGALRPRDYVIQVAGVKQVEDFRYDPSNPKRFIKQDEVPYVNTYRPSYPAPNHERAEAAGAILLKHLTNLIKEPEYRRIFIDFLAYHVQHPGRKVRWGVLLQSTQGAGKTFIAVVMAAVLGRRNVAKVTASNVLDSAYNDWAYGRQLVVLEEVRVIGHSRHGVMDKLKPLISDDEVGLSVKFEHHRTVPNITNYLMFTNHADALAVNDDDRRYFVLASPLQHPEDLVKLGGAEYFNEIFGMVRDNAEGLRAWFEEWQISADFQPEGRAPVTPYLHELAANSASPLSSAVGQVIEDEPHPLICRDLVSAEVLRAQLDNERLPDFSAQALAAVLRERGWTKVGRVSVDGSKHHLWTKGCKGNPIETARIRAELF